MENDTLDSKPKTISKILNFGLMLFNLYLAHSLSMIIIVSRKMHIETYIDPKTGMYPGSALFDFLLRKELIIIPILLIVGMIVKEFKIKVFIKRVYVNLLILLLIVSHLLFVGALPFIFY